MTKSSNAELDQFLEELKGLVEQEYEPIEEEIPEEDSSCLHVFFDGRSAWKFLGYDRKGNATAICLVCGEYAEQ